MEDDGRTGEITATVAVAGADSGGKALFSVRMHVTIEDTASSPWAETLCKFFHDGY
jgi:hypothetical protein